MEEEFTLDFFFPAMFLLPNYNLKACAPSFNYSVYGLGNCVQVNRFWRECQGELNEMFVSRLMGL